MNIKLPGCLLLDYARTAKWIWMIFGTSIDYGLEQYKRLFISENARWVKLVVVHVGEAASDN